jgi:ferredoxin-NADP reductase
LRSWAHSTPKNRKGLHCLQIPIPAALNPGASSVTINAGNPPLGRAATAAAEEIVAVANPALDIHTYICGLNNMVSAVRERLTSFGWNKKQIVFEPYD